MKNSKIIVQSFIASLLVLIVGCSSTQSRLLPVSSKQAVVDYIVGPGDNLQIFVWRNPDLSSTVIVRPDGKISSPLIDELDVAGLTAVQMARLVEDKLSTYIRNPQVSIMVSGFNSTIDQQIRVIGNATNPKTIAYRDGMTLLDVMIEVQGLSEFADGDNAQLIRKVKGVSRQYTVELDSLIRGGDIRKNRAVLPGDTIIIPESWF